MGVRSDDAVTLGYLGCVALLALLFHERVEHAWIYPIVHLAWAGGILGLIWKARKCPRTPWVQARNWYHVLSIPLAFRELHYLVHPINPTDLDPLLAQWDWYLCGGVHPTVWLEQWMHPWLTEYLQVVYSTFYFLPIVLGAILWKRRDYHGFHVALVAVVTAFYLSYLGYMAFPALGPRFELASLQQQEMRGIWLTSWLRSTLDRLELIQRDAFPSGHVGVSLLVLYFSRWLGAIAFVPFLIVVGSLTFSTVYLRYHYVVDVIAGVILALVSWWVASAIRELVDNRLAPRWDLISVATPPHLRDESGPPDCQGFGSREREAS